MARAKRTDRAEARRRNREAARTGAEVDAAGQADERSTAASSRSTAPQRPGIRAAFRESFRPLNIREDLAALPRLIVHRSVFVPIAFTVGTAVLFLAIGPSGSPTPATPGTVQVPIEQIIATFLFQYFVATPPVGAVFLAGFLAPRAGWLTGLIAGIVAATTLTVMMLSGKFGALPASQASELAVVAFLLSPSAGVVFGGAAAWYRRFLMLTNPNRNRRPQPGKASRTSSRRR
ncbi:MAG: hypothetical protein AABZ33_05555 [Chloroflexota bacterium]